MKSRKIYLILSALLAAALLLAACGPSETPTAAPEPTKEMVEEPTEAVAEEPTEGRHADDGQGTECEGRTGDGHAVD